MSAVMPNLPSPWAVMVSDLCRGLIERDPPPEPVRVAEVKGKRAYYFRSVRGRISHSEAIWNALADRSRMTLGEASKLLDLRCSSVIEAMEHALAAQVLDMHDGVITRGPVAPGPKK
jgi:hypothetical protein